MEDGSNFCMACGANVNGQRSEQQAHTDQSHGAANKRLHCPKCGSVHFSPVVESTNTGGVAVSHGVTRRVGVTTYSSNTTHRNYWLCQDCGTKFRNLQNLKEELASDTKSLKVWSVLAIITTAISLLFVLLTAVQKYLFMRIWCAIALFGIGTIALVFALIWFMTKNKVEKMTKEKEYLEKYCFSK
jgi:DNA-directed RNA polymerase subunit RPC12/RpoP